MRRISQHLKGLDSIRLERTMENQEASEHQITLNRLPRQLVNLHPSPKVKFHNQSTDGTTASYLVHTHIIHILRSQRQNPTSPPSIPLVRLIIPLWAILQHALDRLRGTFDRGESPASW